MNQVRYDSHRSCIGTAAVALAVRVAALVLLSACRREVVAPPPSTIKPRIPSPFGNTLTVQGLSCEVGLDFTISISGTVRNNGAVPVDPSQAVVTTAFVPPYSIINVLFQHVSLPMLKVGQGATFRITSPVADLVKDLPFLSKYPRPTDGQFLGHITGEIEVKEGPLTRESRPQPCWFRASVQEPPAAPVQCIGKTRPGANDECINLELSGSRLRWLNSTTALWGNADKPSTAIVFATPPESVNSIWAVRDGTVPYVNEFGVNLSVPRFRVLNASGYISSKLESVSAAAH